MEHASLDELLLATLFQTKHEALGSAMGAMIHQIVFESGIGLGHYFLDKLRASLGIVVRCN
jgi:hypothetical protein